MNLNPKQETSCKEVVNSLMYILYTINIRNLCKMACPEVACIFQGAANTSSSECRKILDVIKDDIAIQVADIPLQSFLHHIEA